MTYLFCTNTILSATSAITIRSKYMKEESMYYTLTRDNEPPLTLSTIQLSQQWFDMLSSANLSSLSQYKLQPTPNSVSLFKDHGPHQTTWQSLIGADSLPVLTIKYANRTVVWYEPWAITSILYSYILMQHGAVNGKSYRTCGWVRNCSSISKLVNNWSIYVKNWSITGQ